MNRKLRTRRNPELVPRAAEVLEVRALLSAGSAAAHAVTQHAAIQTQTVEPQAFHAKLIDATVQFGGNTPSPVQVKFSISNVKAVIGSKVTAHASASVTGSGITTTFKATFIGTVQTITPKSGGFTQFTIAPTGGTVVYSIKSPTQHVTATAVQNGSPTTVVMLGSQFTHFNGTDMFKASSPPSFADQWFTFAVTVV